MARAIAVWVLTGTLARAGGAYEASVDASLDLQYYTVASPFGEPVLSRRRYTSTLGLDVENLQGEFDPRAPVLAFRSRMRVDADFGVEAAERDARSRRYVPGIVEAPLDLMYAYLEGERFFHGVFGFRIGRQYVADVLGYWSFDGALLRATLPLHLELSAFAGFEQRTGLPMLATPRFAADGVWRGDRSELEDGQYPSFLDDSSLAPAAGAAIETAFVPNVHARVAYRIVQSRSTVVISPFPDERGRFETLSETRTASERAGASVDVHIDGVGALVASGVYDLYLGVVSDGNVVLDWYATPALTVGAETRYDRPTFDGDSIFNWFSHGPSKLALGRLNYAPTRAFDAGFSFGARFFETERAAGPSTAADGSGGHGAQSSLQGADTLLELHGRYRFAGTTTLGLAALGERGDSGHRAGADLSATKAYLGGRYATRAVLSLYDWSDGVRRSRDATSFTYVLGASVRPTTIFSDAGLGLEWEHSMNRLVGQRFRVLMTLDLTVLQ